jgi:hypothetical protein
MLHIWIKCLLCVIATAPEVLLRLRENITSSIRHGNRLIHYNHFYWLNLWVDFFHSQQCDDICLALLNQLMPQSCTP